MEKTIYDLKLHEIMTINNGQLIMRVPGGWIYKIDDKYIFVPYNNEFSNKREKLPM